MISFLSLFLFRRASIQSRNKNLMLMGGMGEWDLGFISLCSFLLQVSQVSLLVQLIVEVWQVLAGGSLVQACRTERSVETGAFFPLSFQGQGLLLRLGTSQLCIQHSIYRLFFVSTSLVLKHPSDCASDQIIRRYSVAHLPTEETEHGWDVWRAEVFPSVVILRNVALSVNGV